MPARTGSATQLEYFMHGYYRFPAIHRDLIAFASEDDLWTVSRQGGQARRLTTSVGAATAPLFSPNGKWLAFTARDEGHWEVYVMPAEGGEVRRLSYQGAAADTACWSPDSKFVIYSSDHGAPFAKARRLWRVSRDGGHPELLPYGVANRVAFGPKGGVLLGRHAGEPARWKRYRGGTAGQLWIDRNGNGEFEKLAPVGGNLTAPLWIGEHIYFISDHEGIGNLYRCTVAGKKVERLTHHEDYYVRNATSDGRHIVYHAGGDLYCLSLRSLKSQRLEVEIRSPRAQRQKRFVEPAKFLQACSLHPKGHSLLVTSRGKPFTFANWEGPVRQLGEAQGVRYRLAEYLNDGNAVVCISDASGEEGLEIFNSNGEGRDLSIPDLDLGRVTGLAVNPKANAIALRNHRFELWHIDLDEAKSTLLDKGEYGAPAALAWSPDGRWLAYSFPVNVRTRAIRVVEVATGEKHDLTDGEFTDVSPAWDPEGKYLYFLSVRAFNPVYDAVHFELGFPKAMLPMLITLRQDIPDPFKAQLPGQEDKESKEQTAEKTEEQNAADDKADAAPAEATKEESPDKAEPKKDSKKLHIDIDFENIANRVRAFPVPEGRYGQIAGIKGKALFTSFPVEASLKSRWDQNDAARGALFVYDFAQFKEEQLIGGIAGFDLSRDFSTLVYTTGRRLRVVKAGEKPREEKEKSNSRDGGRSTGWINLDRIRLQVDPAAEWQQMYREAWRLQREHFWTEDMSGVDWQRVYDRYYPLLERIASRSEFSDIMWEMQGELGTSHAYEMGGDYRWGPYHSQGHLGADFSWDKKAKAYRVTAIPQGDAWEPADNSALLGPGRAVTEGALLVAVNGRPLDAHTSPGKALYHLADQEVALSFKDEDAKASAKTVHVKTLHSEAGLRYRDWVRRNRALVREKSKGQAGYLHIPNMMALGYAEFHRGWTAELAFPALVIDVRYNGGGHVSQLLLEKLARRRLGYDVVRWGPPIPYPCDSVLGPMVCVTNENAGSDGDMFSHAFKLMGLGPLVGTRTWGGVVGITRNQTLVDGGLTTQPEFAIWFEDVGWELENYGAEPDEAVEIRPQDYARGDDPQLDKAIACVLKALKENPPLIPDFGNRPVRSLPKLPKHRKSAAKAPRKKPS